MRIDRRLFLAGVGSVAAGCASQRAPKFADALQDARCDDEWQQAENIKTQTQIPQFPKRDVLITDFGARADGATDATDAIAEAIAACHQSGGGRVVVPAGTFFTGPIHLLSNVNLHIVRGGTLKFSTEPERYLPAVFTRWEGMEFMGYSPLVYAYEQTNVGLTGEGTLDGQASMANWWPWKGGEEWFKQGSPTQDKARDALMRDVASGVPPGERHYAQGAYLRPPFVQFYRCRNILIEDVRVLRSPFWLLNPVLCQHVTVRNVRLESLGPNSDGCNPESCSHVVIENCYFDTGDDCIAIKSGRNADGRRLAVPSENILITGCKMLAGHGGVVIGSEISGGCRNVFVENCHMSSPDLERGIRIKTNSIRGGLIENLRVRNLVIGRVRDAVVINFYYEEGDVGGFDPVVRNIRIENLLCQHADRVFQVRGFDRAKIHDLVLENVFFVEAKDFGVIENVKNLKLENVNINGERVQFSGKK